MDTEGTSPTSPTIDRDKSFYYSVGRMNTFPTKTIRSKLVINGQFLCNPGRMDRFLDSLVPLALLAGLFVLDTTALDSTSPKAMVLAFGLALALLVPGASFLERDRKNRPGRSGRRPPAPRPKPSWSLDDLEMRVLGLMSASLGLTLALTPPARIVEASTLIFLLGGAFFTGRWGRLTPARFTDFNVGAVLVMIPLAGILQGTGLWLKPDGEGTPTWKAFELVATFGNPNYLASWLLLILPAIGSRVRALKSPDTNPNPRVRQTVAFAAWWIGLTGLVLSFSRGAWLALIASLVLGPLVAGFRGKRPGLSFDLPRSRLTSWPFALICLTAGAFFLSEGGRQKLSSWQTGVKRLHLYHAAANLVAESPLIGHGPGSFGTEYPRQRDRDLPESGVVLITDHVHNAPLQILVEGGFLLAFFWLALIPVSNPRSDPLTNEDQTPDRSASGLGLGLTAFLIHNFVSVTAFIPLTGTMAALVLGLCTRSRNRAEVWTPGSFLVRGALAAGLLAVGGLQTIRWQGDRVAALVLLGGGNPAVTLLPLNARYRHAGLLHVRGAHDEALARYLVLESLEPHYGRIHFNRGRLDLDRGHLEAACNQLTVSSREEPESLRTAYALAERAYLAGELIESLQWLERALALDPPVQLESKIRGLQDHVRLRLGVDTPPSSKGG